MSWSVQWLEKVFVFSSASLLHDDILIACESRFALDCHRLEAMSKIDMSNDSHQHEGNESEVKVIGPCQAMERASVLCQLTVRSMFQIVGGTSFHASPSTINKECLDCI